MSEIGISVGIGQHVDYGNVVTFTIHEDEDITRTICFTADRAKMYGSMLLECSNAIKNTKEEG